MSTTQELIDGLRAADGRLPALGRLHAYPDAPSVRDLVLLSADRLASLEAENAALKAKLAGVDEKVLAAVKAAILPGILADCSTDTIARAAITAYLAAAGDGWRGMESGKPKPGEAVQLLCGWPGERSVRVGERCVGDVGEYWWIYGGLGNDKASEKWIGIPTHWQPLAAPPAEKGNGQ